MREIIKIDVSELKFDNDINQLVPEMTREEFSDLVKSIDEEGQRTPIHINKDKTVLDGRHRVKALEKLNINEVSAIRENLEKDEALKFVRDTAIERRNLSDSQRLNVILTTDDLVNDYVERAKDNKRKAIKKAHDSNPNHHKNDCYGPDGPQQLEDNYKTQKVETNKEIANLAGVSKSTVTRAKKVRSENPEGYQKVVNGESTFYKEYYDLPSIKKNKENNQKEVAKVEASVKETVAPKPKQRDRREEINERANSITTEEKNIMISETNAMNIISISDNLLHLIEDITNLDLTLQFLKSQNKEDLEKVIKMSKAIEQIIEKGDLQNV